MIGEANGEWLANYVKENDLAENEEVGLLIMTMDTVSSCVPRAEGEYDKFTELVPEFDTARIFKADYDGTTDKGNTAAAAVITGHPEIKTWLVTGGNEECCIGAARALESAAKLLEESPYKQMLTQRYASFDSGLGKDFEDGKLTLEDVVAYAKQNGEPKQTSGKQELYEAIVNMYA